MIVFPNAKINLGLQILKKRADGYHEISSLFYPIPLCDVLEFVPSAKDEFQSTGISIPGKSNLVLDALALIRDRRDIPPLRIHLHKHIPIGAGLGGGSADAAFMITALNKAFELDLSDNEMEHCASLLGSDCAFFIRNVPAIASGRGEVLNPFSMSLAGKSLIVHYPGIHVSTADAYAGVLPDDQREPLQSILSQSTSEWKNKLINDFEKGIGQLHPSIPLAVEKLYDAGAQYASMTGSGSAVYGIFEKPTEVDFSGGNTYTFTLD